jgi:hypothetical protein
MNGRVTWLVAAVGFSIPGTAILADEFDDDDSDEFTFSAFLNGAQEVVPPDAPATPSLGVDTITTASVQIVFFEDLSAFNFGLSVASGRQVTEAHLHCGRPGQNGPVVVFLFPLNTSGVDANGALAQGTRRNQDLESTAEACEALIGRPVRNIASLAGAARLGLIYANVHTVANPAGEVRGQLTRDDDNGEGAVSTKVR